MKGPSDKEPAPEFPRLLDIVQEGRETAREQLSAAWEIHVAKVEDSLHHDWREHLERIIDERFALLADQVGAELERRVDERLRSETERAVDVAERAVRRRVSEGLAQAARRLQEAKGEADVLTTVLQATGEYAQSAGIYVLAEDRARFVTLLRESGEATLAEAELLVSSAAAVRQTLDSGDCVVAMHTPQQLSSAATRLLPAPESGKVTLIPVIARRRPLAVLCAVPPPGGAALGPLEVLAALAGTALAALNQPDELVTIAEIAPSSPPAREPEPLSDQEQELHLRARRVARVQAAEIRLYKSSAVKQGRADANLYGVLKVDIDTRRDAFRKEFVAAENIRIDYFHKELVRTLANDDESLLGPAYPGPLV